MRAELNMKRACRALLIILLSCVGACATRLGTTATGGGAVMALEPVNLIRTSGMSANELAAIRNFVDQIQFTAATTDVSITGVTRMAINANITTRWMAVSFAFRGARYRFEGSLLSSDLLVSSSAIQFLPRLLLGEGVGDEEFVLLEEQQARAPWDALKAALVQISQKAALDAGLSV